jgi:hypothetical protein
LAGTTIPGKSINSIFKAELIAFLVFEQLSTAYTLDKKDKKDIPISYIFDEDQPLVGQLYVSPLDMAFVVK